MFCWDEKMTPSPNVHLLVLVTVVTAVCQLELEANVFLRFKLCQCSVPCYEQQHRAPGQCEATAYVVPVSEQRLECCHWYRLESGVQRCGQQQPASPAQLDTNSNYGQRRPPAPARTRALAPSSI